MTPSVTLARPDVQHMLVPSAMSVSLTLPFSCDWSGMKFQLRLGCLPVVLFHIFPSTLSLSVRWVPSSVGSARGTRGSFGSSPLLAPLLCRTLWSS